MRKIIKEVIPLTDSDCFTVFHRKKNEFTFPLHYHDEMEINLILNCRGIKRIVGDHEEEIQTEAELVFLGGNISHGWFKDHCTEATEITVQFNKDLFSENLLQKSQFGQLRDLFNNGRHGLLFSEEVANSLADQLIALKDKSGFDSVFELMSILQKLSGVDDAKILSNEVQTEDDDTVNQKRINQVFEYLNRYYCKPIWIKDIAYALNISESLLSQLIKKHTGRTYIEILNDIRIEHVSKMLLQTTHTISEIAYSCGFTNFANFNRIFKKKKDCCPSEFRFRFQKDTRHTYLSA